jgi:hypothetical protein
MKVRWTENSLRLRVTPSELAALQSARPVAARLEYPGGSWQVVVRPEGEITSLCGSGPTVCLFLGSRDLGLLSAPDAEGVYFREGDFRYYAEALEAPTECFDAPVGFAERKG